jgi:hypothetical protein
VEVREEDQPKPWLQIDPWQYDRIVANVPWVLMLHGPTDDVVPVSESKAIARGLRAAAADHGSAGAGGAGAGKAATTVIEFEQPIELGHAQTEQCGVLLQMLVDRLTA